MVAKSEGEDPADPSRTKAEAMKAIGRTVSESEDFDDLELAGVEPLTLDDIEFGESYAAMDESSDEEVNFDPTQGGRFFTVAMAALAKKKRNNKPQAPGKKNWMKALNKIKDRGDPWEKFHLEDMKSEKGKRHRYNPLTQEWVVDACVVKMDKEPFAHGAMRECFRMKKLSNFSMSQDWGRDSNNYVAKSYMDGAVPKQTYFDDVKLQMDAKLWGEEYNRRNPPKKVDIFMMGVLELIERPGAPLFHIEHHIDGEYIKYNSNSGFVEDTTVICRKTPQAFSHFTFERSGHEVIVVDIQGVGDLYTDPQIHTATGEEYGDGNLGTKGMALFFHSHVCNDICRSLGLTPFDLSTAEHKELKNSVKRFDSSSETRVKLDELLIGSPTDNSDFSRFRRGTSGCSESASDIFSQTSSRQVSECEEDAMSTITDETNDSRGGTATSVDSGFDMTPYKRRRGITECEESPDHRVKMRERLDRVSRPSSVAAEMKRKSSDKTENLAESILGSIHLDLAVYHETCRFNANVQDEKSAHFHLRAAADCGCHLALVAISSLYMGLPNDILPALNHMDVIDFVTGDIEDLGLDYMTSAAFNGDVNSMLFLARAFDSGLNLGKIRSQSFREAISWYEKAVEAEVEKKYLILARMAELSLTENSGCRDPNRAGELYSEAAEAAMEEMCGKLANKYYALSEEAWALVEE